MSGWTEIDRGHLALADVHCDTCGQRIARKAWVAEVAGCEMRFCSEKCAGLMETYYLPRHGLPSRLTKK